MYDRKGVKVKMLYEGFQNPGVYIIEWDGRNDYGSKVASGVYILLMKAGSYKEIRKIVVVK